MSVDLDMAAWKNPESFRKVMTVRDARTIMLQHQGYIFACGEKWNFVLSKPIVGTVTMTLSRDKC